MREARLHYADYRVWAIVERDGFPDDVWISAEPLLPETIAEYGNGVRSGLVIFGGEVSAEQRGRSYHLEVTGAHQSTVQTLGPSRAGKTH